MNLRSIFSNLFTKENPAQSRIAQYEGSAVYTDESPTYAQAFDKLETVSRGSSLIIRGCSGLDFDVKDKVSEGLVPNMRQKQLVTLLNFRPNPYQSTQEFRTHIFTDFILEGNIFIYFDGKFMWHLPASKMEVNPDSKTFVAGYKYNGETPFKPEEIIHIKDISSSSIYRGSSRLASAERSIKTLWKMQQFQDQFFDNGAVAGIVIETDNTLSSIAKEKTINYWIQKYSVKNGARKPMILDSGLKLKSIGSVDFQDMDFDNSIKTHDTKILKALGVPPILLDGGNNANISPNLRLFYLETVAPIVRALGSAFERYFGYDVEVVTADVSALQPDIKDIAQYHTTLVNGGIETPAEAREFLRLEPKEDTDKIRVPANIAGSATNPGEGGAPPKPKTEPKDT